MKLEKHGSNISKAEITHISQHGIWVLCYETEYFLPYEKFPWFKKATINQIYNLEIQGKEHLYWPDLDVDLSLSIIEEPEKFELISKA